MNLNYIMGLGFAKGGNQEGRIGPKISQKDEEELKELYKSADLREKIFASIAPSISASKKDNVNRVKQAVACLLFGGARKALPDNTKLRGDINVLLLGDPGTAKSQFLKFVHRVAPVCIYTSGKGSSAAGLTAAIIKSQDGFSLEGGAMVGRAPAQQRMSSCRCQITGRFLAGGRSDGRTRPRPTANVVLPLSKRRTVSRWRAERW